jgi:membrane-associated protease RseP (regulator of RpoE activity)
MESEEYKRVEFHYGVVLLRTKRFQAVMDRLGATRISKPIGWLLLYAMPVAAFLGFYLFLSEAAILLSPRGGAVAAGVRAIGPLANIGLPGINPYLPLVDGWIALIVAMVVHEGAHGVVARSLGLPVKASGLLFFLFVPIGAFVDVDEGVMKHAKSSHSGRVLAAGAGINLIVGVVSLLLLVSLVAAMAPAANGIPVTQVNLPSPAAKAGILPGDFILAVNGIQYTDGSQVQNSSWYTPGQVVNVTLWRQGTVNVIPLTVGARPNTTVTCGNPMVVGTASSCTGTVSGYLGNITGDKIAFESSGLGTFNSTSCAIAGDSCSVSFTPSAVGDSVQNITATYQGDDYNLLSAGVFSSAVVASLGSSTSNLGSGPSAPQTASDPTPPLGYIGTESLGLGALRGIVSDYASPLQNPWQYVCIPTFPQCQSRVPFSDALVGFYSSPLGSATAPVANLLYWFFFINFNLAIFNALPIYPLDGGQAFAVGVKALGRGRLSESTLMRITSAATFVVIAILLGVIVGPYFL